MRTPGLIILGSITDLIFTDEGKNDIDWLNQNFPKLAIDRGDFS